MAQQDILDIFEDCMNRLMSGQSVDDCLQLYPQYASRLRPYLEVAESVQTARIPAIEILEDQEIAWQSIEHALSNLSVQPLRPSFNIRIQLFVAIALLLLLTLAGGFALTRPDVPDTHNIIVPIELSITPSPTLEDIATDTPQPTASPTQTSTPSSTPSPTLTHTLTMTSKSINRSESTHHPSDTSVPTLTVPSECGTPLTIDEAVNLVLEIYPNTTITVAKQATRFGDTLVWEIETSHDIKATIDVACGYILTLERQDTDTTTTIITTEAVTSEDTQTIDSISQSNEDETIESDSTDANDEDSEEDSEDDEDGEDDEEDDHKDEDDEDSEDGTD